MGFIPYSIMNIIEVAYLEHALLPFECVPVPSREELPRKGALFMEPDYISLVWVRLFIIVSLCYVSVIRGYLPEVHITPIRNYYIVIRLYLSYKPEEVSFGLT